MNFFVIPKIDPGCLIGHVMDLYLPYDILFLVMRNSFLPDIIPAHLVYCFEWIQSLPFLYYD